MTKVYVVEVFVSDDYEYEEDSLRINKIDSIWSTRDGAESYINGLKSYVLFGAVHQFRKDVEEPDSDRSVELIDSIGGYADHTYLSFVINEVDVRN